jgi:hypothetical protein
MGDSRNVVNRKIATGPKVSSDSAWNQPANRAAGAFEELAAVGKVQPFDLGQAHRWTPRRAGFPPTLLLPGPLPSE